LISFLEFMDQRMNEVFQQRGMQALRENPELMGTSVGMLRRAANTLHCLAKVADNQPKFARYQSRLLNFTMSQLMDSRVAATISDVLFELMNSSTAAITLPKMAKFDIIANSITKGEHSAVDPAAVLLLEPSFNTTAKPVVEKHVNFVLKKNCVIDLIDDENDETKTETELLSNNKTELLSNNKTELLSNSKTELLTNSKTELLPNSNKTELLPNSNKTELLPNKPSVAETATSIIMEQEVVADTFDETSSTSSQ